VQTEHNGDADPAGLLLQPLRRQKRLLRIISAVVILVFFTIYCASGIVAGARLFESTFGMSYETALWPVLPRPLPTPSWVVSWR
jgi:sodium/proline symporter